jgi:hypothetical protein
MHQCNFRSSKQTQGLSQCSANKTRTQNYPSITQSLNNLKIIITKDNKSKLIRNFIQQTHESNLLTISKFHQQLTPFRKTLQKLTIKDMKLKILPWRVLIFIIYFFLSSSSSSSSFFLFFLLISLLSFISPAGPSNLSSHAHLSCEQLRRIALLKCLPHMSYMHSTPTRPQDICLVCLKKMIP